MNKNIANLHSVMGRTDMVKPKGPATCCHSGRPLGKDELAFPGTCPMTGSATRYMSEEAYLGQEYTPKMHDTVYGEGGAYRYVFSLTEATDSHELRFYLLSRRRNEKGTVGTGRWFYTTNKGYVSQTRANRGWKTEVFETIGRLSVEGTLRIEVFDEEGFSSEVDVPWIKGALTKKMVDDAAAACEKDVSKQRRAASKTSA